MVKKCPFCGSEELKLLMSSDNLKKALLECPKCLARSPSTNVVEGEAPWNAPYKKWLAPMLPTTHMVGVVLHMAYTAETMEQWESQARAVLHLRSHEFVIQAYNMAMGARPYDEIEVTSFDQTLDLHALERRILEVRASITPDMSWCYQCRKDTHFTPFEHDSWCKDGRHWDHGDAYDDNGNPLIEGVEAVDVPRRNDESKTD